jgi:ADP-ribose pyrophosphatase
MLEVPAGKLDVPGEPRLACAQRELAEEVGLEAGSWEVMHQIYPSPGFSRELVTIYEARDLRPVAEHRPIPDERIEIVPWPLLDLDAAIAACEDAKSLVGLLILRNRLGEQEQPEHVSA